jgi:hypothetical protein
MEKPGARERRSFAQVIVIGGASCTGKTTLTERLLGGQLPALAAALGVDSSARYHVLHGIDWNTVESADAQHILVQYDLTADTPLANHGRMHQAALDLLSRVQQVTILTVWEQPEELKRRLTQRFDERGGLPYTIVKKLRKGLVQRAWRSVQRFRERRRLFSETDALWALYQRWFQSCAHLPAAQHWIVRSTTPEHPTKLSQSEPPARPW